MLLFWIIFVIGMSYYCRAIRASYKQKNYGKMFTFTILMFIFFGLSMVIKTISQQAIRESVKRSMGL